MANLLKHNQRLSKGILNVLPMQETDSDINDGYWDVIRKRIVALVEWAKPNPEDPV